MSSTLAQWQSAWPIVVTTALSLPSLGWLLAQREQRRQRQQRAVVLQTLDYLLTLIQKLQRHRALGGRSDGDANQQRMLLASELDRLWHEWPHHFPDAAELPSAWQPLRRSAADFDGHCRLIDRLLAAMELVEQRTGGRTASGFGVRCRVIEDLGQLRGLSVRAAALPRCPVQLEVPLRYLCLRLAPTNLKGEADPEVHNALREIEQRLLQRRGTPLQPADCFALLTPLIDRALDRLRSELQAATPPLTAGRRVPAATTVPIWSAMP